ncbi:MAG: hypothetical protein Q9173_004783 [Seirophora scorigena]
MGVIIGLGDAENPNKGYQLFITALVMLIVAALVVLGRFAARWAKKGYGYDDYAILVSLLFSIILTVTYFYIAQVLYKVIVGFNKISILMLYLRIFISKSFRLACHINLGIVVAFTIGSTVATVLQCIPIAASWDKNIDATCTHKAAFWYAFAVINILTDAIILILPVHEILRLQLNWREKIGLLALFSLGTFVTVSSVIRVTAVANSVHNQSDITCSFSFSPDLSTPSFSTSLTPPVGNFIPRGIWTLIEANSGIICASLPMLYKPAAIIFPCLNPNTTSNASPHRNPPSKAPGSSYVLGRRYPIHSGKASQGTLPDSSSITVAPAKGRRFPNHGFGSRTDLWVKEEDEYPLGGEPSSPSLELGTKVRGGKIMRQVDVDVTYQDHPGRAVTSDQRVQHAREAV